MAKTSAVTFSTPHGQDIVFGQDNKSTSSQSDVSDKENTGTGQDSNSQKTIGSGYGTGLVDYRKNLKFRHDRLKLAEDNPAIPDPMTANFFFTLLFYLLIGFEGSITGVL